MSKKNTTTETTTVQNAAPAEATNNASTVVVAAPAKTATKTVTVEQAQPAPAAQAPAPAQQSQAPAQAEKAEAKPMSDEELDRAYREALRDEAERHYAEADCHRFVIEHKKEDGHSIGDTLASIAVTTVTAFAVGFAVYGGVRLAAYCFGGSGDSNE